MEHASDRFEQEPGSEASPDSARHPLGAANALVSDPPPLPVQFENGQLRFDAGKMGTWVFLLAEILFFGGLFCAYFVFRAARPEVFVYAHYYMDSALGALNTCVLLVSSLTAAVAVRCAQQNQRRAVLYAIAATIACGVAFLTVKGVEYSQKYEQGLMPGRYFSPVEEVWEREDFRARHPLAATYAASFKAPSADVVLLEATHEASEPERAELLPLFDAGVLGPRAVFPKAPSQPLNAHAFFGLYFVLTGIHALHVVGGVGVWAWLFARARRSDFGSAYFGPVDYAALYWHLVDMVWLFLFPLFYLIH
jgi:cytochrome c oxidase subunit 3